MVQFKPGLLISSPAGLHHTSRFIVLPDILNIAYFCLTCKINLLKNKVTLYLPILVHPRIILISRVRLGEVVMKHCQDATFDVKNVFWFILLAINLSNLSCLEIKFDWFFKQWSKVSRNWRDLQGIKTARCPVDFVQ